jgi:hypothetical protein
MRVILYSLVLLSAFLILLAYNPELLTGPPEAGYQDPALSEKAAPLISQIATATSLVGAMVVFVVYWFRFGHWTGPDAAPAGFRPHPTRHSTTWIRYIVWGTLYAGFMVGCYFFIILFPQVLVNLIPVAETLSIQLPYAEEIRSLIEQPDLSADDLVPYALIFTLLAWGELVERPEKEFRRRMQASALIPAEGQSLVDCLEQQRDWFQADLVTAEAVAKKAGHKLLRSADFEPETGLVSLFARASYLHDQLRALHSRRLKRVARRHREELVLAGNELESICAALQDFRSDQLRYLRDLAGQDSKLNAILKDNGDGDQLFLARCQELVETYGDLRPYAKKYFEASERDITTRLHMTLTRLYQVAVCSVLAMGRYPAARIQLFRSLGFHLPDTIGITIRREAVVRSLIVVVIVILLCSVAFYLYELLQSRLQTANGSTLDSAASRLSPESLGQVWWWTLSGTLMHMVGILGGYLMERSHERSRRGVEGDSSARGLQLADYAECFALGFALNVFFLSFMGTLAPDWDEALKHAWPWAFVPAVTAAFTGFYMQQQHAQGTKTVWRFAFFQGFLTTLVTALVLYTTIFDPQIRGEIDSDPNSLSFAVYCEFTALILGVALGWVLQDWVRQERLSGIREKRVAKRRHVSLKGRWSSALSDQMVSVRAGDLSESGVKLRTHLPDDLETDGVLIFDNGQRRPARVARHDDDRYTCLEFTDLAASEGR